MPSWSEILDETRIHKDETGLEILGITFDGLRHKYISQLSNLTGRNVIIYYSAFQERGREGNLDINDSDMTGFMNSIYGMDVTKGLDLIIHTPGGDPNATEGIVKYLHSVFEDDMRVIVPHMAMSAGTMLACAANELIMGKQSCLGPIDPQINGMPAYDVLEELKQAQLEINNNPNSAIYWNNRLSSFPLGYFKWVSDCIEHSHILTNEWLKNYMFKDNPTAPEIDNIIGILNSNNKSHARHFSLSDCLSYGMKITALEDNQQLQESVLSLHHAVTITLNSCGINKVIENQLGYKYLCRNIGA